MLEMQQFCITQTEGQAEPLGYVGEHLAKTLEIKSDTGLDWVYRLEVIIGNDACRIDGLVYDSGMLRLPLTSSLLRAPGLYTAQVVGTHGKVVRKSNLFFLRVHPSVSADRDLPPEEPTLFQQQLAQMSALAGQVQSSTAAAETAGKQARKAAEDARQSAEQTAEALKEWEEFVADQGSIPVEDEVARAGVENLRIRVEKLEENPGTDHNLARRVANLEAQLTAICTERKPTAQKHTPKPYLPVHFHGQLWTALAAGASGGIRHLTERNAQVLTIRQDSTG